MELGKALLEIMLTRGSNISTTVAICARGSLVLELYGNERETSKVTLKEPVRTKSLWMMKEQENDVREAKIEDGGLCTLDLTLQEGKFEAQ